MLLLLCRLVSNLPRFTIVIRCFCLRRELANLRVLWDTANHKNIKREQFISPKKSRTNDNMKLSVKWNDSPITITFFVTNDIEAIKRQLSRIRVSRIPRLERFGFPKLPETSRNFPTFPLSRIPTAVTSLFYVNIQLLYWKYFYGDFSRLDVRNTAASINN